MDAKEPIDKGTAWSIYSDFMDVLTRACLWAFGFSVVGSLIAALADDLRWFLAGTVMAAGAFTAVVAHGARLARRRHENHLAPPRFFP